MPKIRPRPHGSASTQRLPHDTDVRLTDDATSGKIIVTNHFVYNGDDLRVSKTDSAGASAVMTDGTTPASPVLKDARAVYTPGISERTGTVSKFYHGDALGSTRGITNSSQTVTDAVLYDAFDMTVSRTGTTATPFGFVGAQQYQTDGDSGLQLLGHRYYDPSVGRFISSDPAKAGTNSYAYCANNALKQTDPTGLDPGFWDWLHKSVLGPIMNFPNNVIGAGLSIGGRVNYDPINGAYDVNGGIGAFIIGKFGLADAFTIGQYIMHPATLDPATYAHEVVHVRQGELLGSIYLPATGVSYVVGGVGEIFDPRMYGGSSGSAQFGMVHDNSPMEIWADRESGNLGSNTSIFGKGLKDLLPLPY